MKGGQKLMAAWGKEGVDTDRHRQQEKREANETMTRKVVIKRGSVEPVKRHQLVDFVD